MKEFIVFSVAIIVCIAFFATGANEPASAESTIIGSQETFKIIYNELYKGKELQWNWEANKDLPDPKPDISFWIEDSNGNKYYEVFNSDNTGSFIVPYDDKWTLNWENPYSETSDFCKIKLSHSVEKINQPPIASIEVDDTSELTSLTVHFKGNAYDTDGVITSHYWDFGDKTTSTEQNPSHTYSEIGTYTVTLTVTDDDGATGKDTVKVTLD